MRRAGWHLLAWGSPPFPWGGGPGAAPGVRAQGQGVVSGVTGMAQLRTLGTGPLVLIPSFFRREGQGPQRGEGVARGLSQRLETSPSAPSGWVGAED